MFSSQNNCCQKNLAHQDQVILYSSVQSMKRLSNR